jgi:hypothetical protein
MIIYEDLLEIIERLIANQFLMMYYLIRDFIFEILVAGI